MSSTLHLKLLTFHFGLDCQDKLWHLSIKRRRAFQFCPPPDTRMHTHSYTHKHTHTHTQKHTDTHTHTRTHTRTRSSLSTFLLTGFLASYTAYLIHKFISKTGLIQTVNAIFLRRNIHNYYSEYYLTLNFQRIRILTVWQFGRIWKKLSVTLIHMVSVALGCEYYLYLPVHIFVSLLHVKTAEKVFQTIFSNLLIFSKKRK